MNQIRYVEHNAAHPGGFTFDQPEGHDCWLLLLTHTPALFWVDGTWTRYPPGSAVLFAPGMKILYKACGELYENDWLRFDSDEAYVASFPVRGVPFSVPDPQSVHTVFCQLTWEHRYHGGKHADRTDHLIRVLFLKLHEAAKISRNLEITAHFHALTELRRAIYSDPQHKWRVKDMADRLHLSEGYLQAIYRKTFGVSCMEDVIASRIRAAESLLQYTNKTSLQIAEFCGYGNAEHFCRQFKKLVGKTPGEFRKWVRETAACGERSHFGSIFP